MNDRDDRRDALQRLAEEPLVQAAAVLGSAALLGWLHLRQTPLEREAARAQADAEMEDRKRLREQHGRYLHCWQSYFAPGGEGGVRLEAELLVRVGPEPALPDAAYRYRPAGFRQARLEITSASTDASLTLSWDVADRTGGLRLERAGHPDWGFGAYLGGGVIATYDGADIDIAAARFACRLLAILPEQEFHRLRLWPRRGIDECRKRLWRDHMLANPALAADIGWRDRD